MYREISREFFVGLSNDFLSGNLEPVFERFHCPLVIYLDDQPHVFTSQVQIRTAMLRYREILVGRGAQVAAIDVARIDRRIGRMESYFVTKTLLDWSSAKIGTVKARYFLKELSPKIEMIEYIQNPFLKGKTKAQVLLAA
ncbi:MAG: hypothetical protein AAFX07_03965 [Pseudomonadota bacterium]